MKGRIDGGVVSARRSSSGDDGKTPSRVELPTYRFAPPPHGWPAAARRLRRLVGTVPAISRLADGLAAKTRAVSFQGSSAFWEQHYARGGRSGLGSYGELAEFKAGVLNEFVATHGIASVLEFGCGDGNQLALAEYPNYVGLDPSRAAIDACIERFADDPTKSFFLYDPNRFVDRRALFQSELSLSLDVIYHLIEDPLFEIHMRHLFGSASRFVAIYSSDSEQSSPLPYVRNRSFTPWVEANVENFELVEQIPNRFPFAGDPATGSRSDFYIYARIEK